MNLFSIKKICTVLFSIWSLISFAQTEPLPLGVLEPFWRNQPVLGPYLQNGIGLITVPDFMFQTDFPYKKRAFSKEVPFADNLSVVRLLGGYASYPGVSGKLTTDLSSAENIALLAELRAYDFVYRNELGALVFRPELIEDRLQHYLEQGYEDLTIVLDNVPWDLTANPILNSYGNKGVPDDAEEWYKTIQQLCTTLSTLLGVEKANKLRFRIGTEMNGLERFDGTEDQFITHYDYAAAAIENILPGATLSLFNISGASMVLINTKHNVGAFRLLDHIANEPNRKTGIPLNNLPPFVSVSRYFYEGNDLAKIVTGLDDIWNHVNDNISGYQDNFSREIHEFGALADWDAEPATNNKGAFGGAMTLQLLMGYMEIGLDRLYHWNPFKSIPSSPDRYQIPTAQAWIYSVFDYLSGEELYKVVPDDITTAGGTKITSILSVQDDKAYLVVNAFNVDRENSEESEVVIRIPKSYLPTLDLIETQITSLTNTTCVLNEIRRDVESAGNLNPLLDDKPNYIPSNFQNLATDYSAFKAMVLSNADTYETLWKESLNLSPFGGSVSEEGDYFVIKLNMTAPQSSVLVLHNTIPTGTFTANPTTVTEFTIDRGAFNTGTTTLTWSGTGVAKTVVTHSSTLTSGGGTPTSESLVSAKGAGGSQNFAWVRVGYTYTFYLYEGTRADFDDGLLGEPLETVVVVGDSGALGIEDTKINDIALDVFPNPVGDVLHIETASEIQALQIYSITGQKLKEITMDSSKNATIDVSHLEPTIYIVQITTLEGVFSKQFVKK